MKQKIVLTRNFKNKTSAKYCAAVFGQPPENAVELDNIDLENPRVYGTHQNDETKDFDDFGCGTLIIGFGELPEVMVTTVPQAVRELPAIKGAREIQWNGFGFTYKSDERGIFNEGRRLIASGRKMLVTV